MNHLCRARLSQRVAQRILANIAAGRIYDEHIAAWARRVAAGAKP